MHWVSGDVVIEICWAFKLRNKCMGYSILSIPIPRWSVGKIEEVWLNRVIRHMFTYLHAFGWIVLAATKGNNVWLIGGWMYAVFFQSDHSTTCLWFDLDQQKGSAWESHSVHTSLTRSGSIPSLNWNRTTWVIVILLLWWNGIVDEGMVLDKVARSSEIWLHRVHK